MHSDCDCRAPIVGSVLFQIPHLKATEMLQSDPPRSDPPLAETEIIEGLTVTQDVVLTHTDEKII